jgi:mono/diheme cytochrome c family protein
METFFYVIGGVLVLLALGISFFGMRSERFPSDALLRVGILVVALVVAGTAYGAVKLSQDEAQHREDEQNREAASEVETIAKSDTEATGEPDVGGEQAPGNRQENDTEPAGGGGTADLASGDPKAGAQVFESQGCSSCHSLQAAGATGTIGPNLDAELADKDPEFIETSIVDPSAFVEKGFEDGIMPSDYEDVLTPDDLANLVAFLSDSTSKGPSADKPSDGKLGGGDSSGG